MTHGHVERLGFGFGPGSDPSSTMITGPRRLIYIYLGPRQTLGTQGTRITTRLPCFRAVPFVESPFYRLSPSALLGRLLFVVAAINPE